MIRRLNPSAGRRPNPSRIGQLADDLRAAAWNVTNGMRLSPGKNAYEYHGSTEAVDDLIWRLNDLEEFMAGRMS